MNFESIRANAFAMPLTSPAFPLGPFCYPEAAVRRCPFLVESGCLLG
jgi:acetoacetate decarboxylase